MRRFFRGIGALIVLLLIAGAVAIGVIALTSKSTGVKLKDIGGNTVHDVAKQIDDLIKNNTK